MLGALLAGCSAAENTGEPTAEPPLGTIQQITTPEQVIRPLDAYLPSVNDGLPRSRQLAMARGYS
ncbi:MAG: hypothetical protein LBC29_04965 [Propionibacteriaceae bacterium]|nr:hypothetical protein [Propionibacteriaceae bacterium]